MILQPLINILSIFVYLFILQPQKGYASKMVMPAPSLSPLESFDSCNQFKARLYEASLNFGKQNYDNDIRSFKDAVSGAMQESMPMAKRKAGRAEKKAARPSEFTGTNNQHDHIDEADFVKFDGRYMYQLQNGQFRVIKAWPAKSMQQLASLAVEGSVRELLMGDGVAVVMTALSRYQTMGIYIIDIRKPSKPEVLTRFDVPGAYMTARLVGHTVRIVTRDHSSWINYGAIDHQGQFSGLKNFKWKNAEEKRRALVQNMDLTKALKFRQTERVIAGNRQRLDVLGDCKNVYMSADQHRSGLTRIVTLNLKAETYSEAWAFIRPETVYVSSQALYLAQSGYVHAKSGSLHKTAVHKFDLNTPRTSRYVATGVFNGKLLNQFAMDEYKGHLRVAVNSNESVSSGWRKFSRRWRSVNRILVLKQADRQLNVIGQTKNLAEGERIYAVRFAEDKGFLVTFRQVDPLFTLDLSNPRNPQVVGELKVPGFSSYIHVLDNGRLLTIGKDADPKTGRARGLKLSLFDTSDFKNPREIKSLLFNTAASSEAFFDHKAFSFYRKKGILAIPMTARSQSKRWLRNVGQNFHSSLLLFKISDRGIKSAGELSMSDLYASQNGGNWRRWQQNTAVRRSFFADGIVYAVGNGGIRAAKITRPEKPVGTVRFQQVVAAK